MASPERYGRLPNTTVPHTIEQYGLADFSEVETEVHELVTREHEVVYQTYKRLPLIIDRAEGCYVYTTDGRQYLDMLSGIAVNALGHSHPSVVSAIYNQTLKYLHVSNYFYQEPQILLAEQLLRLTGGSKVFFSNSGAESWEGAVKLARKWGSTKGKSKIVTFEGGFHGRTYGALSAMSKPLYKDGMGPFLDGFEILPYNDVDALTAAVNSNTLAIGLELIQGEGGVRSASIEFIDAIEQLRQQYNVLLIVDEVQTGIGRTGSMYCYEQYGITPDIITTAKALGGGLPLGAIIAADSVSDVWSKGNHGTTYGGNAAACCAGLAVLRELEEGVLANALRMGAVLKNALLACQTEFSIITDVRGKGLMVGIELSQPAQPFVDALLQLSVITNATSENVLRILPPLIVTETEIQAFIVALRSVLSAAAQPVNGTP